MNAAWNFNLNNERSYRRAESVRTSECVSVCVSVSVCQNKRRTHQNERAREHNEIVIETTNFMVIIVGVSYCFIKKIPEKKHHTL